MSHTYKIERKTIDEVSKMEVVKMKERSIVLPTNSAVPNKI